MRIAGARSPHTRAHRTYGRYAIAPTLVVWALALGAAAAATGCVDDDVGNCCAVVAGTDPSIIPVPMRDENNEFKNIATVNLKFTCEDAVCVTYKGSEAFCSRECLFNDSCPEGFNCERVIVSRSGPGPDEGPKSFCVKQPPSEEQVFMCTKE